MASKKIKGITIEIGGDTTKLGKALEESEKSSRNLSSELRSLNKLLKLDPTNVDLIKQKQDLLTKSISATEDKLKTLKQAQKQVQDQFDKGEITEEQYRDFQREIIATEKKLKGLKDEAKDFGANMDASLKSASEKVSNFGSKAEATGKKMLGVTAGVTAVGVAAVNTGMGFDEMMSKVKAVSQATEEDFEKLRNKAQELGATTKFSASESAEALNFMAMAGWKTEDMLNGIDGVLNLAAASGTDLATTSDIVTDALTALGMKANESGKFADILAVATSNANTTVEGLGESFKYVAPLAGAMGYSAEDLAKALGLMANAGIKGSMSGTALKTAIANMASPTKAMKDAMDKYNISLTNSDGTMKTLDEVMLNLRSSLGGLSETEQAAAASTIFGKEAMAGMLAIVNGSDADFKKLSDALKNADGSAKKMSDTMQDNLSGDFTTLKSQLEGLAIQISDILMPIIRDLAQGISNVMTWLSNLSPTTQKIIVIIAGLVAALGPILIIIGKIAFGISSILALGAKLAPFFAGLAPVLAGVKAAIVGIVGVLTSPIAIIVAIVGAIVLLYTKCEWFRNVVNTIIQTIWEWLKGLWEWLVGFFAGIGDFFVGVFNKAMEVWNLIAAFFISIVAWIDTNLIQPVVNFFVGLWNKIVEIFTPVVQWFAQLFTSVYNTIKSVIDVIVALFKGSWELIKIVWGLVAQWFNTNVVQPLQNFFRPIVEFFRNLFAQAVAIVQKVFGVIVGWFSKKYAEIKFIFSTVGNWFKGIFNGAVDGIKNAFGKVTGFFSGVWSGIKSVFGNVASWFGSIFSSAWNKVKSVFSAGGAVFAGITNGIASTFKNIVNSLIGGINRVVSVPFNAINRALSRLRGLSIAGASPFSFLPSISVPQIPKLAIGTNKIEAEGLYHLHKNEAVVPKKYNPAVNNNAMKEALLDAMNGFKNSRMQYATASATASGVGEVASILKEYMPEIIKNLGNDIVLDDRTLVGKIAPKVDKQLGAITMQRRRGH